jgi:hypothetical protein
MHKVVKNHKRATIEWAEMTAKKKKQQQWSGGQISTVRASHLCCRQQHLGSERSCHVRPPPPPTSIPPNNTSTRMRCPARRDSLNSSSTGADHNEDPSGYAGSDRGMGVRLLDGCSGSCVAIRPDESVMRCLKNLQ